MAHRGLQNVHVKKYLDHATHMAHTRTWSASACCTVHGSRVDPAAGCPLEADIALLTPGWPPAVPHQPVVVHAAVEKFENIIVFGMWINRQKPIYNKFFSTVFKELEGLINKNVKINGKQTQFTVYISLIIKIL